MLDNLFARIDNEGKKQPLIEHLSEVENGVIKKIGNKEGECLGILHDIAKASSKFQKHLLDGINNHFRHPIAALPIANIVLNKRNDPNRLEKLIAIYYHHSEISYDMLQNDLIKIYEGNEKFFKLEDKELDTIFNYLEKACSISFTEKEKDNLKNNQRDLLLNILKEIYSFSQTITIEKKKKLSKFYYALVASDWESSSREGFKDIPWDNIYENFQQSFNYSPNSVQKSVWNSQKNKLFLVAPTGSGKTEASLNWALRKAKEINAKKIIYVLPFKALIEDIHKRMIKYIGENYVDVWHSDWLSTLELDNSFNTLEEFNFYKISRKYFLKKPIILTTADQIIHSFLNVGRYAIRSGIFENAVFVFDEIQAYGTLFRSIIYTFLNSIDYYFITTATPPAEIYKELKIDIIKNSKWNDEFHIPRNAKLEGILSIKGSLNSKKEDKDNAYYNLIKEVDDRIKKFNPKRVAIIVNTVKKAINIYKELKKTKNLNNKNIVLLHSRMLKKDKKERIDKILNSDEIIAITTQVIEAGVDTSFDFMLREIAPISSIIQSIGRVNRNSESTNAKIIIFKFKDYRPTPYDEKDLSYTEEIFDSREFKSKVELENNLTDLTSKFEKIKFEEDKEYANYITNVYLTQIWSVKRIDDIFPDLRESLGQKSVFVEFESQEKLYEELSLLKSQLIKQPSKEYLEKYINLLKKLSNSYLTAYEKSDKISEEKYREDYLGE